MKFITALVVAATASAAPNATDQFDLKCVGTSQIYTGAKDGSSPKPAVAWLENYRIDLTEKAYCEGSCSNVNKIFRVTPDELRLLGDNGTSIINRSNGRLTLIKDSQDPRGSEIISAVCERQTFTSFPRKF